MGFYGLAYIIKVEQCEHIKKWRKKSVSMEQLLLICRKRKEKKQLKNFFMTHTMAINKNKLIETRWKEKFENSQTGTRERQKNRQQHFSQNRFRQSLTCYTQPESRLLSLWHIFTSCKTCAGFFLLLLTFFLCFRSQGRENCWATTYVECKASKKRYDDGAFSDCLFLFRGRSSRLWERNSKPQNEFL